MSAELMSTKQLTEIRGFGPISSSLALKQQLEVQEGGLRPDDGPNQTDSETCRVFFFFFSLQLI